VISAAATSLKRSPLFGQIIRFFIAGGLSSVIYSLVYLPLTTWVFPSRLAVAAVPFAFAVAVTFGFFAHSRWSFKDHGTREHGSGQRVRFVAVQASGLMLNGLVTWIGTALLNLPPWAPLVPAILLAAIMTFILNRLWVFG
jgi:putative flippase GtrA